MNGIIGLWGKLDSQAPMYDGSNSDSESADEGSAKQHCHSLDRLVDSCGVSQTDTCTCTHTDTLPLLDCHHCYPIFVFGCQL
jgi:hypothetical protein